MVFMADSERAAKLARAADLDAGLHLNLSEPFTGQNVSPELRRAQERICRFLKSTKYALLLYHPFLRRQFSTVFRAQHAEFLRLYETAPTHIDGHQHMHLATNILIDRIITPGGKVRRSFSFTVGQKSVLNRWYRARVDRMLAKRHILTDYFFALSQNLQIDQLKRIVQLATRAKVELMTHPQVVREYDFLMSDEYAQAIATVQLMRYANH